MSFKDRIIIIYIITRFIGQNSKKILFRLKVMMQFEIKKHMNSPIHVPYDICSYVSKHFHQKTITTTNHSTLPLSMSPLGIQTIFASPNYC